MVNIIKMNKIKEHPGTGANIKKILFFGFGKSSINILTQYIVATLKILFYVTEFKK